MCIRDRFSAFLVIALVLGSGQIIQAAEYELGPFTAFGFGSNPNAAQSDAYGAMYDMLEDIAEYLPEGHTISVLLVEEEDWISPNNYFVTFSVVVDCGGNGGGGGGGGGGTGGPGK